MSAPAVVHVHTYRRLSWLRWDGLRWCTQWWCTSCPVGAVSARIIPVGEGAP